MTNIPPGAQLAAFIIAQTAADSDYAQIEIGYESSGMLWIPFHCYLSTEPSLRSFDLDLVYLSPRLIVKFKGSLMLRRPKDGGRDDIDITAWPCLGMPPVGK